jgi:serpin B
MKKHSFSLLGVILAVSTVLAVLGLAGVSWTRQSTRVVAVDTASSQKPQASNAEVNTKLVAANTRFGFKLLKQLLKQDADENIFLSPSSMATALAMTYNGAREQTQQAMAKTLELQGMSLQEVNGANAALKATLENLDPKVRLSIANSLWARNEFPLNPEFVQKSEEFYGAKVKGLNFSDPSTPEIINTSIEQSTNGKINQIVDKIDPTTNLFLINAIHFKGNWTREFEKTATQERPFTLLNGTQKQHLMMSQSGNYQYYQNELFQALSLPYGEGRLSMLIFLPNQKVGLKRFYESLNAQNWEKWITQFAIKEGSIVLPRFKLEYDISLSDALKALGMEVAFAPDRANFTGMTSNPADSPHINQVKQKTLVEVNEEGTEAAATTSVEMNLISYAPERFNMSVDRPFFCAIRDNQTGTILFMGSIVEPI